MVGGALCRPEAPGIFSKQFFASGAQVGWRGGQGGRERVLQGGPPAPGTAGPEGKCPIFSKCHF